MDPAGPVQQHDRIAAICSIQMWTKCCDGWACIVLAGSVWNEASADTRVKPVRAVTYYDLGKGGQADAVAVTETVN